MGKVSKLNELISVVVPIYNVEQYLRKCIDSILNQTYKNIEIILIDDGSLDSCPKICDEYIDKDSRIRVFHKKNGGLSDARNYGIERAKGKYITFIDSDDYIETDYIEYLIELINKFNVKISACGHNICFARKIIKKSSHATKKISKEEALEDILYDKEIDICSWGKLYDIELFNGIRFPKGKIFEDTATTYLLLDKCDFIAVGDSCKYNYVMRDNSITTKKFNIKKMQLIEMTEIMCDYLSNKYPNLTNACNRRLMWAYLSTYTKIVYTNKNEYKKEKKIIKNYIIRNRKNCLKDNKLSRRDNVSLIIYPLGDFFFKLSWNIYKKIFN